MTDICKPLPEDWGAQGLHVLVEDEGLELMALWMPSCVQENGRWKVEGVLYTPEDLEAMGWRYGWALKGKTI